MFPSDGRRRQGGRDSQYQKRSRGQGMSVGGAGDVGEVERIRGC